jgi:phosphopantetheinyl transferase
VPLPDHEAVCGSPLSRHVNSTSFGGEEPGVQALPELEGIKVQELTVEATPVFWSCAGPTPGDESKRRKRNKSRVLLALLTGFLKKRDTADSGAIDFPFSFRLFCDSMGKPGLVVNNAVEPGISFSHCYGVTWGALADPEWDVGIDAARADEFEGDYPFHRVFHTGELNPLLETIGRRRSEAAALVWSAKEAFVKAVGCGFHLFSPLEVTTAPLELQSDHARFRVRVSNRALDRLKLRCQPQMEINSFRFGEAWVSVTVVDRNCSDRTGSRFGCLSSYGRAK